MEFGQEFSNTIIDEVVVATSDVLHIVNYSLENKDIIFNYPSRSPADLQPFLVTGILTLNTAVIDENLWAVLTLLSGLRHATNLLREKHIRPECIEILTRCFESRLVEMGVTEPNKQQQLIKNAIVYAFQKAELYPDNLKPEKKAWDNAKNQWEKITEERFVDIEEHNEPIPSLLIKGGWRQNAELREHINEKWVNLRSIASSDTLKWYHKASLVASFPLALLSLFALINSYTEATKINFIHDLTLYCRFTYCLPVSSGIYS